jgi:hypothetical protein
VKQSKEYNYAYNSGFYAGQEQARKQMESESDDIASFALAELSLILARGSGYLRIGLGKDSLAYARYKWTQGPHADCYTFGSGSSLGLAIAQMCERVDEVESGKRKPTPDTGYRKR